MFHVFHVGVAVHVFPIEIRNHGENRRELEERTIAFIRFCHQILRGAEAGVRAHRINASANNDGRIEAACTENTGYHGRRGGLAVHAGNGDSVLEPHEFGQHFSTLNDGDFARAGFLHFRIVGVHRGAGYDHRCAGDVTGFMAFIHNGAQLHQPLSDRRAAQIGSGNFHVLIEQNFGDTTHADSADANEVCVLRGCKHGQ